MSYKNSKNNLSLSVLVPVAYGSVSVLSVLRCFQVVRYIDSETGFFVGGNWLKVLIYGLIAAVCLAFVIVSFLSAEGKKIEVIALKDRAAATAGILFSLSLLYDSVSSISQGLSIFSGISVGYIQNSADTFKILMSSGALPYVLQGVFAVISAVYILILAGSFNSGSKSAHNHKLLALAPIGWAAFKMITRFVKQISYIRVSDLFLELIMISFMITFFVALSQVVSGIYSDDARWRITALGFSGAVLALVINIPRLVLTLLANDFVNAEYPFNPADAMFGVFAFAVAVASVKAISAEKSKNQ